jgi:chromate transporter
LEILPKSSAGLDLNPSYMQIFLSFLRLGATAFGGPSMVAYLQRYIVEKKHWLEDDVYRNGVALCQAIPGPTTMQTAGYVGLKLRGLTGAIISFTGFGLPSFFLMLGLAGLYTLNHDLPIVTAIFSGLQAIIVTIIAYAFLTFGRSTLKDWRSLIVAGIAAALFALKLHPILVILVSILVGLALNWPIPKQDRPPVITTPTQNYNKQLLLLITGTVLSMLLLYLFNHALFELAALMARISLFSFGGGYAAIPLMSHEIVTTRAWLDNQSFMNGIILGQVTPGPVMITATYVGYLLHGLLGAGIATLAIFLPSFIILVAVTPYFERFRASPYFNTIIKSVLCSFVGLLLTVTINFAKDVSWDTEHIILAVAAFLALIRRVDILWVVLVGAVISFLLFYYL